MRSFYAIIGHPVSHSLSPRFQQAAFDAVGIDAAYLPFDISSEALPRGLDALRTLQVSGFNITIPHKEAMKGYLDERSVTASEIGAVNTVVSREGRWLGDNTDGPGFQKAIERFIAATGGMFPSHVLVFGAGGSARAVLWALSRCPVMDLCLVTRTKSRGEELLRTPALQAISTRKALSLEDPALKTWVDNAPSPLLINTLSLQAFKDSGDPFPPLSGLALDGCLLFDLSYVSGQAKARSGLTPFLSMGSPDRTFRQNGLGMLLLQGALAFELWTGLSAPLSVMEETLRNATGQDSLWEPM